LDSSNDVFTSIANLLSTANGRQLMGFLDRQYNAESSVGFNEKGMIDPYQTHFNEGCRHVYLKLREIEKYSQSNE